MSELAGVCLCLWSVDFELEFVYFFAERLEGGVGWEMEGGLALETDELSLCVVERLVDLEAVEFGRNGLALFGGGRECCDGLCSGVNKKGIGVCYSGFGAWGGREMLLKEILESDL